VEGLASPISATGCCVARRTGWILRRCDSVGFAKARSTHPTVAGAAHERIRRGFPHRKSGSPDLHTPIEKPTSGRPEIGAQLRSFNFPNSPI
jgi:hypothetical protein